MKAPRSDDSSQGEKRYTLAEAAAELARRECQENGHDFSVVGHRSYDDWAGTPVAVRCDRCREEWSVEQKTAWAGLAVGMPAAKKAVEVSAVPEQEA